MRKSITKMLLLLTIGVMTVADTFSQCPFPILTGASTSGNARCPIGNFRYERGHYIITAAEMAAAGYGAGPINAIQWTYSTAASVAVTGNLAVYFENTSDVTNLKSLTWATAIGTMTNSRPSASYTLPGTPTTSFSVPITTPFNYTGGGLYVAYEWSNAANPLSLSAVIFCNTAVTGGVSSAQSNVGLPATTAALSAFRAITTFYGPATANDAQAYLTYGLGNMAVGYATNYQMRGVVYNPGTTTLTSLPVTITVSGANSFTNTQTVASLAPCTFATVTFSGFTPTAIGANTVTLSVPADGNNLNNTNSYTMTTSKDITSYRYVAPVTGGVGFNGGTGDFVGKFTAANNFGNSDTINGFEVIFTSLGQPYNVVVYDDDGIGGLPGTLLYASPSGSTIQDTVFISLPDIEVSGGYYVGIRQTSTTNVGFGYQTENPVRSGEFYYGAIGSPGTDFSPAAPFRITATVQYKTPVPPNCALYLAPTNAGVACQFGTTLTYGSGGGGPTGYRVYFGTNQALVQAEDPGTLVQNSPATSYATGVLSPATTYYWRITAYNLQGDASGCAVLSRSFTTNLASCYCASTATNGAFEYITNVASGVFNNASGSTLYSNNTGLGVINNVNIGGTFNVTVTQPLAEVYDEDRIYIYADWNHDGDWNDAGELCGNGDVTIANGNVTVVSCTVPITALPGNTLLRIKFGDEVSTTALNNDPCQVSYTFGEVEDYLLNVTCGSTAASNTPVCELASLNLTSTYLGAGTPTGYSWTTTAANGFTSSAANPTVTASASSANDAGTYTVVITDNNSCTSSASVVVTVNQSPDPVANGSDVCAGAPLGLSSADNNGGATGYSWTTTATNGFTSLIQSPSVTASATAADAGVYTVVITNTFLCTGSASVTIAVNPNPSLALNSTSGISCFGGPCDGDVTVTASGGTPGYLYTDPNFNLSATGIFTGNQCEAANQTMTVTDSKGCEATVLYSIGHISAAPPSASVVVPPIVGLPASACNGTGPVAISIPAVAGATYYTWDGPAGTTINGGNPVNSPTPSGNITFGNPNGSGYYIGVQAANGCGTSTRKVQWVRGSTSVPASVTGNTFACANTLGAAYSTGAVTGATAYFWTTTGDMTIATGQGTQNVTVDFGPSFTSGTLCVASQTSCFTSAPKCITILNSVPTLPVITGSATVCPGPYVFSVPVNPNIASYTWVLPAGITGSSSSNSINVTVAPGFSSANISVTGTSTCGINTATRTKSLSTGAPATPSTITGVTNGVCGQTLVYQCPSVGGVTYTWTIPAGTINSGQGTNAINATLGTFVSGQICVTTSNGCGTGVPRCVSVNGKPNAPGAITATPISWCANTLGIQFDVDVAPIGGSYTLSWLYPSSSVATYSLGGGNSTQLILDWITGSGPVNVTASNACGNSTRTSTQANSCREGEQAIASTEQGSLQVYPNPTKGMLRLDFVSSIAGAYNVNVTDLAGRSVMMQQGISVEGANGIDIDLTNLAKGMYMINLKQNNETRLVKVSVE